MPQRSDYVAKFVNALLGWGDKSIRRSLVGNLRKCTPTRPRKRWQDNKKNRSAEFGQGPMVE